MCSIHKVQFVNTIYHVLGSFKFVFIYFWKLNFKIVRNWPNVGMCERWLLARKTRTTFVLTNAITKQSAVNCQSSNALLLLLLLSMALQPSAGYGLLVTRGFLITHNDAPQSVGLLLDKWSARRRELYLATHNRETSMTTVGFEPTFAGSATARSLGPTKCFDWNDKIFNVGKIFSLIF
jgi:hypothetical protein